MKTVICRKCKYEFDPQYGICPNCGSVWALEKDKRERSSISYIFAWIAIGLVVLGFIFSCTGAFKVEPIHKNLPCSNEEEADQNGQLVVDTVFPQRISHIEGEYKVTGACYSSTVPYSEIVKITENNGVSEITVSLGENPFLEKPDNFKFKDYSVLRPMIEQYYDENGYEIITDYVYTEKMPENTVWSVMIVKNKMQFTVVTHDAAKEENLVNLSDETVAKKLGLNVEQGVDTEQLDAALSGIDTGVFNAAELIGMKADIAKLKLINQYGILPEKVVLVPDTKVCANSNCVTAIYPDTSEDIESAIEEGDKIILHYYPEHGEDEPVELIEK